MHCCDKKDCYYFGEWEMLSVPHKKVYYMEPKIFGGYKKRVRYYPPGSTMCIGCKHYKAFDIYKKKPEKVET